jgi:hypothetical protein
MEFESGTVDWTDTQNLESGWLRSRVHTQFLTMSHEAARGRLDVQAPAGEKLEVANGHEVHLESLLVADNAGDIYVGREIPAGAAATLTRAVPADMNTVRELMMRDAPERPDGADNSDNLDFLGGIRGRPRMYYGMPADDTARRWHKHDGITIRELVVSAKGSPRSSGDRAGNPGAETGLTVTTEQAGYHLILGFY